MRKMTPTKPIGPRSQQAQVPDQDPREFDDELLRFEAEGAPPVPPGTDEGRVEHDGAQIWYSCHGRGAPVILLHGGLGHSGNWSHQTSALVGLGYRVILIDSRGHGRSTRDDQPYRYERMANDVLAVMDRLDIEKAALVGWSDGACVALILADLAPQRAAGVFFFGCNMDPSGARPINELGPVVNRCFTRHSKDYAVLSATPEAFKEFVDAVSLMMKTQPNYSAEKLSKIKVPVTVAQSENEEFIRPEHAEYLAKTIPGAELVFLPGVSHFAPLQRPEVFNRAVLGFLKRIHW